MDSKSIEELDVIIDDSISIDNDNMSLTRIIPDDEPREINHDLLYESPEDTHDRLIDKCNEAYVHFKYKGNSGLTRGNVNAIIDGEMMNFIVKEMIKCKNDPIYFAENYYTIIGQGGKQLIKPYEKQAELINLMINKDRVCVVASRQAGKCVSSNTKIKIRNKTTGEIEEITVEEFKNKLK